MRCRGKIGLGILGGCIVSIGAFTTAQFAPTAPRSFAEKATYLHPRGLWSQCMRPRCHSSSLFTGSPRVDTCLIESDSPVEASRDKGSNQLPFKRFPNDSTKLRGAAFSFATATVIWAFLRPETAPASITEGLQVPMSSNLPADTLTGFFTDPAWNRYAFMFPVGLIIATCAQTAGIGGASMMGPFFLLVLPLLGPEYPLHSVAASVATGILSEAFGFLSGLAGYFRRGLVDVKSALPFIAVSLPSCFLGATLVPYADDRALKALYAVFMLGLSAYLFFEDDLAVPDSGGECMIDEDEFGEMIVVCTPDGQEFNYKKPGFGMEGGLTTAFGGFLTGILGVGIGEVVIPQLVRKNSVPLPVAAGTSVLVVFLTAFVAASTQLRGIISSASGSADVIPWNLLLFFIPGVVAGGQLAPRLQGRLSPRTMEVALAGVFGVVGLVFAGISGRALMDIAATNGF